MSIVIMLVFLMSMITGVPSRPTDCGKKIDLADRESLDRVRVLLRKDSRKFDVASNIDESELDCSSAIIDQVSRRFLGQPWVDDRCQNGFTKKCFRRTDTYPAFYMELASTPSTHKCPYSQSCQEVKATRMVFVRTCEQSRTRFIAKPETYTTSIVCRENVGPTTTPEAIIV